MAPVGYRFHPTEQEIISHYLTLKMNGHDSLIGEVDFYRWEPWDLPAFARIKSDDRVWYFFCRLDYKYANGKSKQVSRTTKMGYWKLTGKVRDIKTRKRNEVIGTKKTLVYQYKSPDSKKAIAIGWVVHEFQAINSPPNQRALVLCKLKHKAGETSANSPHHEGQPSRGVTGCHAENNVVRSTTPDVDIGDLISQFLSNGEDFNLPFSLQSHSHLDDDISDEEENQRFADSLFAETEGGYYVENSAHYSLPNSLSDVYGEGSSDRATEVFHAESFNPHEGHNRSKEYRQMQMAHGDDVLLMGPSSAGSVAATTKQINCIELVREELPAIRGQYQLQSRDLVQEFPAIELQANFSSTVAKDKVTVAKEKAIEAPKPRPRVVLPRKESFGTQAENERKIIRVTNAKPDFKLKSNESASNDWKGRFIRFETPPSSDTSCPPLFYLFKAVLGLVLFVIMLREAVIVR